MPFLTDDPIADFYRHEEEQERWLRSRPVCCKCKEHIQEPEAVNYKGEFYCNECEGEAWEKIRDEYVERIDE